MPPAAKKASSVERLQRRKTDMAQYAAIVAMVSLPPSQRPDETVDATAHWLQRKSQLLQEVELAIVRDVARHCDYLCAEAGQPIVRQGDIGDAFYVILEGHVSVYVRDEDAGDDEAEAQGESDGADGGGEQQHRREHQHHHEHDQQTGTKAAALQPHRGKGATAKHVSAAAAPLRASSSSLPQPPPPLGAADESGLHPDKGGEHAGEGEDGSPAAPALQPRYGNKVANFGTGGSFGELALISDDSVRAASVVADVRTDLLVVHRELYNRSIKAYQERDLREARRFVESHRFFRGWPARQLHQVVISLRRLKLAAGEYVARQGAAVDGLHFLRAGKALVTFQPRRHREQYAGSMDLALYDAVAAAVAKESEQQQQQSSVLLPSSSSWPSLTATAVADYGGGDGVSLTAMAAGHSIPAADAVSRHKLKHLTAEHLHERRLEGYAAAERRHLRRHHDLCLVSDGEVLGDVEHSLALPTYMMTVRAVDDTTFYHLDAASVERLLGSVTARRHAGGGGGAAALLAHVESANADIRDSAMVKWSLRGDLYRGAAAEIPLLRYVTDSLRQQQALRPDTRGGRTRTATVSGSALLRRRGRELPRGDALFRHMLNAYALDRAELVQPYVPGAVYYKELMKDRARQRQAARRLAEQASNAATAAGSGERFTDVGQSDAGAGAPVVLPSTLRKRMEARQPRSISVLKSVIKTLQTSDVDTIIPRRVAAPPPPPALAQFAAAAVVDQASGLSAHTAAAVTAIPALATHAPPCSEAEVVAAPPSPPAPASPSRDYAVEAAQPLSTGLDGLGAKAHATVCVAVTIDNGQLPLASTVALFTTAARSSAEANSAKGIPTDVASVPSVAVPLPPAIVQQSDVGIADPNTTGVTVWRNHTIMHSIILEDAQHEAAAAKGSSEAEVASSAAVAAAAEVVAAARTSGRVADAARRRDRGCHSDNVELAEGQVLKFFSPYLRGKLSKMYEDFENPEIRRCNRETSILEKRILQFYGSSLPPSTQKDGGESGGGDSNDPLSSATTAAAAAAGLLTRLNRLEALNAVVKPGGRCVVKKSVCRLLNCEFQLKSHKHTRYHIVGATAEDAASKTAR